MTSLFPCFRSIGLGLTVGAIFHSALWAQATPPIPVRADSAAQDSIRLRQIADSIAKADTLRHPLQSFPAPPALDDDFVWKGEDILATGALSLAELIARVPGASLFRAGSLIAPSATAFGACFTCVRIYLDGVEVSAVDPRSGGVLDNSEIPLWSLDEVRVVRGAGELRVYLKSASVVNTIPYTRLDLLTGADETSLFGIWFGKRSRPGHILQVGGQQLATSSRLNSGSGDRGSYFLRLGTARRGLSIDATVMRSSRARGAQERSDGSAALPPFEGSRTDAYLRTTLGRPDSAAWVQVVAASINVSERTPGTGPAVPVEGEAAADTSRTESQYLIAAGSTFGFLRASASARFRSLDRIRSSEFSAFAHASLGLLRLDAQLRRDTRDSSMLGEVSAVASPFRFIRFSGSVGQRTGFGNSAAPDGLSANADVAVGVNELWLHGGAILRDTVSLLPPKVFDANLVLRNEPSALGTYARLRGPVWRDIHLDVRMVQWDADGVYLPKTESQATLFLDSWALHKFPNRTFHIYAGVTLENRSSVTFPVSGGGLLTAGKHSTISSLVEIRIVSAVITWQNRNIRGLEQSEVPGLQLPRRYNVYGVRWVLWN